MAKLNYVCQAYYVCSADHMYFMLTKDLCDEVPIAESGSSLSMLWPIGEAVQDPATNILITRKDKKTFELRGFLDSSGDRAEINLAADLHEFLKAHNILHDVSFGEPTERPKEGFVDKQRAQKGA